MSNAAKISAECLTPILYVRDFTEALDYYTEKLLFDRLWEWGNPPDFGAVRLGKVEIFFCLGGQGHPGTWLSIFVDDVDDYFERITRLGAEVIQGPTNYPWGCREVHVRDPNQHVIRFSQGIPMREPKMEIERVPFETRIEKRLAALLGDLARHKNMSVGEMKCHPFAARHATRYPGVATIVVFGDIARTMSTLEAKVPDLLLQQVRELAEKQKVSVDQIVPSAFAAQVLVPLKSA